VRSRYRIFGSKPELWCWTCLIEAQNWTDDQDLVLTLTGAIPLPTVAAPEAFAQRLQMQIVLHNQDNREHDLLDSDDYYQFQGGLTAAVRALTGKNSNLLR